MILFSAQREQHPPIDSHPQFHTYFPAIQPILPTHTVITVILTNNIFPYFSHSANSGCVEGPISKRVFEDWSYFDLSLSVLPRSMDKDCRTQTYSLSLRLDNWHISGTSFWGKYLYHDQNEKPSTLSSSTYYHYFHTVPTPSKDLRGPWLLFFSTKTLFLSSFCQPV